VNRGRFERSINATLAGLAVNAVLAGAKTAAGVLGQSQALIADGIESFADILSSLLVWRGVVVANIPPDEDHPYGHGKAEALAAVGVTVMLLIAALWISVESVRQIITPHLNPRPWTLAVLVGVIAIKETLFRFVRDEARELDSTAVQSDAWHHRSDAITSLAAFVGILIAVLGGKGYESADDFAALIAAAIIAWNAVRLLRPAMNELMDATPGPGLTADVRAHAAETPGVAGIEKCRIRKTGGHYFVDMHVEVDPQMTVVKAHEIAHELKNRVQKKFPTIQDVLVHVEPAGRRREE